MALIKTRAAAPISAQSPSLNPGSLYALKVSGQRLTAFNDATWSFAGALAKVPSESDLATFHRACQSRRRDASGISRSAARLVRV
jgi:hypothetical protein